ncbi:MAG: RHS repeat-associated core domain-containing protein [Clostridia bacterium]|nr:RHS repeat-associated core domain-containing protein [Clostridia bacterium]
MIKYYNFSTKEPITTEMEVLYYTQDPQATQTIIPQDYSVVSVTDTMKISTKITIDKRKITALKNMVSRATLVLRAKEEITEPGIEINGTLVNGQSVIEYSITDWLCSLTSPDTLEIVLEPLLIGAPEVQIYTSGVYAPAIDILLFTDNESLEATKRVPLVKGAEAYVDALSGGRKIKIPDINDEAMGINIFHMYIDGLNNTGYGENFILNLNEKLSRSGINEYIYRDALRKNHYFTEKFFYTDENGVRTELSKEDVIVETDGTLIYENSTNSTQYKVDREALSHDGLKLQAKLERVKNIELYEQRTEEIFNLSKKISTYKSAISEYVISARSGAIVVESISYSDIINKLSSNQYVVLKSNALTLQSLASLDGTDEVATARIEAILSDSNENLSQLKVYFKEQFICIDQLAVKKRETPINFVSDSNVVKGFNENDNLVAIYKKNGDYIYIEYEEYYTGNATKTRISRVYDNNKREIRLEYNEKNLLSAIIDSMGKRTAYEYEDTILKCIYYPDFTYLEIGLESRFKTLVSSEKEKSYINSLESSDIIVNHSMHGLISDNNIAEASSSQIVSKWEFIKEPFSMTIKSDDGVSEYYKFNTTDFGLKEYYKTIDEKVVKAQKYLYTPFESLVVKNVDYEGLYGTAPNYQSSYNVTTILGKENLVLSETMGWKKVHIANDVYTLEQIVKEYTYDEKNRPIKIISTKTYDIASVQTSIKKYILMDYDINDNLLIRKTYIDGEERTNGIDIEEFVYDENLNLIKTIKYNSLNPTSKYYFQGEKNALRQTVLEYDASGRNKTEYEYFNNTNKVSKAIYANGSELSHAYNDLGKCDGITMSTEDGLENFTHCFYTAGLVTRIENGDDKITYEYDYKNRIKNCSVCGTSTGYSYYETDLTKRTLKQSRYGAISTEKNHFGKVVKYYKTLSEPSTIEYFYDEKINLIKTIDTLYDGRVVTCEYVYNQLGALMSSSIVKKDAQDNETERISETYTYNEYGELIGKSITIGEGTTSYLYTRSNDSFRRITGVSSGDISVALSIDPLLRNTGKSITYLDNVILNEKIKYLKFSDHTTNMPVEKDCSGDKYLYKYDKMGNITEVYENGTFITEYKYDLLGRLVRENNKSLGKTYVFVYDTNGNILEKQEYDYTLNEKDFKKEANMLNLSRYEYDSNGLLSSFNGENNKYIATKGLPSTYRNIALNWYYFDELYKYGDTTFDYDTKGRRILKNNISFTYDTSDNLIKQSNGIEFIYDNNSVIGIKYNGTHYFYQKDLLNNVVKLLDTNGSCVVKYVYDAWGNHKVLSADGTENTDASFIGNINPIRYRSYYFDTETNLYYLKSRYYDPQTGRFISIDDVSYIDPKTINGTNLFAYCGNNPVMFVDPTGKARASEPISSYDELIFPPYRERTELFYVSTQREIFMNQRAEIAFLIFKAYLLHTRVESPKMFGEQSDMEINPSVYVEGGALGVESEINFENEVKISGQIIVASVESGIEINDSFSAGVQVYWGLGFTIDFTNGINIGGAFGLGFEINLEFEW